VVSGCRSRRLEDGESESLAYLIKSPEKCLICSAEAIVFRVLALLDRVDQGSSLDEIPGLIGLGRSMPWEFSKQLPERRTQVSRQHRIRGGGLRGPGGNQDFDSGAGSVGAGDCADPPNALCAYS
jgi:hypothetical protein